jgi:hypothetical protein
MTTHLHHSHHSDPARDSDVWIPEVFKIPRSFGVLDADV